MNPLVGALSLYDVVATPGVGADLGHINTGAPVCATLPDRLCCRTVTRIALNRFAWRYKTLTLTSLELQSRQFFRLFGCCGICTLSLNGTGSCALG